MRYLSVYGLFLLASALADLACGTNGTEIAVPTEWAKCDRLGKSECGLDSNGRQAVMLCSPTESQEQVWKVLSVCYYGCEEAKCIQPPSEVKDVLLREATGISSDIDLSDVESMDVIDINPDWVEQDSTEVDCIPKCEGKVCGDDGCGGTCGQCDEGQVCINDGTECCTQDCFGKLCGDDGCGGSCGECPEGWECNAYFQCAPPCQPNCQGKECGDDGCGGSCGECPPHTACGPDHKCSVCIPQCEDKECGDNGCGGQCGACPYGYDCIEGKCELVCIPNCVDKECGDDQCGGSCGDCMPGAVCDQSGKCVIVCEPQCEGKSCGPDGCGGVCGKCAPWEWCSPEGQCVTNCVPNCENKLCGDDGCGGSCGTCGQGSFCNPAGQCVTPNSPCISLQDSGWCDGNFLLLCIDGKVSVINCLSLGKNTKCEWLDAIQSYGCKEHGECLPNCQGKECGDDGCGGSCGDCPFGMSCEDGICTGESGCGNITYVGCCSENTVVWCDGGYLWFLDCSTMADPSKKHCGWNTGGFYDCVEAPVPGPPEYPLWCQGACVPSCIGKQCGSDGCGGSCGDCPAGLECVNFQCQAPGGGCGPYTQEAVCQGDTVVWCENDHIVFYDCQKMGPFYHCGWVPELYMNNCYKEECIPDCENKECGPDGCGYVCGYCPVTMYCNDQYQCVYGQGLCGDITYEGECQGNTVVWCQNGVLQKFDCTNLGPGWQCAWWEQGPYYWCVQQ